MARRYFSSTAVATTLSGNVNNSATSIDVTALSGFPNTTPWTAIIDKDTASEEVVTVTNVSGTTLTVTRGVDGTSAVSHNAGASFSHGVSARDFDEANSHVNDTSTDVHSQYVSKSLISGTKGAVPVGTGSAVDDLAPGSNGQMLMADSGATLGLRYVDPPANRNMVINGAMQVAQRGTSVTGISDNGVRTADRWKAVLVTLGTWTQSVENDAPSSSGLRKSLKMTVTTADASPAAGDIALLRQDLEGLDCQRIAKGTSAAQQVTLSFWVKSNLTGTFIAYLFDNDNSRTISAAYTISQSATWERKVITFAADTTGILDNDNNGSLLVSFGLAAGSDYTAGTLNTSWAGTTSSLLTGQTNVAAATNNYWQITGVQLETGPVATPFEFEPYEATLRKCQRYYYLLASGSSKAIGIGSMSTSAVLECVVPMTVSMRTAPSLVVATGTDYYTTYRNGANDNFNSLTLNLAHENAANIYNSSEISGTAGHAGLIHTNNASASVAFSAEL